MYAFNVQTFTGHKTDSFILTESYSSTSDSYEVLTLETPSKFDDQMSPHRTHQHILYMF